MLVEGPWSVALWFVVPGGRPRQSSLRGGACGRMAVQSSLWGQQHACSGLYPPSDTQRGLSPLRLAAAWRPQKNLGRTSRPFLLFDSGSSIRISRVVEVLALAVNYGLAKPIADVY